MGARWGERRESRGPRDGKDINPLISFIEHKQKEVVSVSFPYFGNRTHEHFLTDNDHPDVLTRAIPAMKVSLKEGETYLATVFDLLIGNYGIDRGLGGKHVASSYDDDIPYTPAWQEKVTGVPRDQVITIAREFAENAHKTHGRSMIIVGAALNHWFHMDMTYRSIINLVIMCGCVGQSGGGWAHYVGQENTPTTGWVPLALPLIGTVLLGR